ncbi:hypothetical protein JTE90_002591 [Oedothorax gibbosus]|uniref:SUZ RNA-binding domain-containing n=1 Tax=Oedothorax gibbosus TaxID=931172 RepID=A0AAV6V221_9ARAC|nr:hypothetical protein JTE90_002591 [Oedothorax gibbosus]
MEQDVADDVCDSWEDMIENGILEKKLGELQLKLPKINSAPCPDPPLIPQMRLEDPSRTPYTPQVKILKRPSSTTDKAGQVASFTDKSPSRQPPKTLQQREAEYAEARLRILGSAHSEEEPSSASNPNSIPPVAPEKQQAEVIVTRLPKGPDGTDGFSLHR